MGEKFKEHWQVALITAFAMVLITTSANWVIGKVTKVDKAATETYVDDEIRDKIEIHEEKESIYRENFNQKLKTVADQVDKLYTWELEKRGK
jgi:low affinity Fe/Cu permease